LNATLGPIYNFTILTTIGDAPGMWNVTIIANDTSGNLNASIKSNFSVNDVTPPAVIRLNVSNSSINQGLSTNITLNVTDNYQVDSVLAQITRANGSAFNVTMTVLNATLGPIYNFTILTTIGDAPGMWNVTIIANDTSGKLNTTVRSNFTVNDVTSPLVTNVSPTAGRIFNQSSNVSIAANATDNYAIDTVLANVTLPNGSIRLITLLNNSGNIDIWNNTFTETNLTGIYNVTIIANDTAGNVNRTVTTFFVTQDGTNPAVVNLSINPTTINQTQSTNITVNVTDNVGVDTVLVEVTRANGSAFNRTMSVQTGTIYNFTLLVSGNEPAGLWNVTIIANDTASNVNNTIRSNFTVNDITAPRITTQNVTPGIINQSGSVNATAVFSDETARDTIIAQVTRANGSSFNITMSLLSGNLFNATILTTINDPPGQWNITFIANDSTGNVNRTVSANFTVVDVTNPSVVALNATPGIVNQGLSTNITVNVTDNYQVDTVLAQVTRANGSAFNVTMTVLNSSLGPIYNFSLNVTNAEPAGGYNITIIANDTSGNLNATTRTNFTVVDVTLPRVFAANVTPGTVDGGNPVNATVNFTDETARDTIIAQITRSNGSSFNLTMTNLAGNIFNATVITTVNDPQGLWNITFIGNDSAGNVNNTVKVNFTIADASPPRVINLNATPSNITQGQSVNVNVNVTDNINISTVIAQITRANGSAFNITMSITNASIPEIYNASVGTTLGDSAGLWNVTIIANDSSGNVNTSVRTNFTLTGIAAVILRLNQSTYRQGTSLTPAENPDFGIIELIPYVAQLVTLAGTPVTTANCTVTTNTTSRTTQLAFNSTLSNYTGSLNTVKEFDNQTFTVTCTAPNYQTATNSTTAKVIFLLFPIETRNISFGSTSNNLTSAIKWLSKAEPTSAIAEINRFEITVLPNATNIDIIKIPACGSNTNINCSFLKTFNMIGSATIRANISVSQNNTCRPFLCYHAETSNLETTFESCGNATNASTSFGVIEQNISLDGVGISQGGFLSAHIHCNADPALNETRTINVSIAVNYSGEPAGMEILTAEPTEVVAVIVARAQEQPNYSIAAGRPINITRNMTTEFNNSINQSRFYRYNHDVQTLSTFHPTIITNTTRIHNSTGQLWAADNASLGTPEIATISTNDVVTYNTETIPGFTLRNETIHLEHINALRNNETIITSLPHIKTWTDNITNIFTNDFVIGNVTGISNYSTFNVTPDAEFGFVITVANVSGTFDVTNQSTINRTTQVIRLQPQRIAAALFTINATDAIAPRATNVSPAGTTFNQSTNVTIAANVTDGIGVDTVLANVSLPNGSIRLLTLRNSTVNLTDLWNFTFTETNLTGAYNVTLIANDTAGNVNRTVTTFFITQDGQNPAVINLALEPPRIVQSANVTNITVNVTDNVGVGTVLAQIKKSNGSISNVTMTLVNSSVPGIYNYTLVIGLTDPEGIWNITIIANDTNGNINRTVFTNFTIDRAPPLITNLTTQPPLPHVTQGTNVSYAVNFTSNEFPINITFTLYNSTGAVVNVTGPIVVLNASGLPINFTLPNNLSEGTYTLNMTATDFGNNSNTSFVGNITIDRTPPTPNNTTTSPPIPLFTPGVNTSFSINFTPTEFPINATFTLYNRTGSIVNVTGPIVILNQSMLPINFTLPNNLSEGIYSLNLTLTDQANNSNTTFIGNITIDRTAPNITNVTTTPTLPLVTQGNNTNVTVNLTSNEFPINITITLYNATGFAVNVTGPIVILNASQLPFVYLIPNNLTDGTYTPNMTATDLAGNNNHTLLSNITIDTIAPRATNVSPAGTTFNQSTNVTIAANVTDLNGVDTVLANVSLPNGSSVLLTLLNHTVNLSNIYNATFTQTNLTGAYNVTIIANDTAGNVNRTVTTFFITQDGQNPRVVSVNATPGIINQSQATNITVNVTDNVGVGVVLVEITRSNGSRYNRTMSLLNGSIYNASILVSGDEPAGQWNATIIANDTSGNVNTTIRTNFTVNDITAPRVVFANVTPAIINHSQSTNVTAIFFDETARDTIIAQVTRANGSSFNITMTLVLGNLFNATITTTIGDPGGQWNITFIGNDTSGNVNRTVTANFTVVDVTAPSGSNITTQPTLPLVTPGVNVSVQVNFTPNEFPINVTFTLYNATGTPVNVSGPVVALNQSGLPVNFTLPNNLSDGVYSLNMTLRDPSNNSNTTFLGNITIDRTPPRVVALNATPGNISVGNSTNITVNVTDNFIVDRVLAQITRADGSAFNLTMSLLNGTTYNATLITQAGQAPGIWNITIIANDTAGNVNNTARTNINVFSAGAPTIINITPTNGTIINRTAAVTISANITDPEGINTVTANVTLPNGSTRVLTMQNISGQGDLWNTTLAETSLVGTYTIIIRANDTLGNLATNTTIIRIIGTPPSVLILAPLGETFDEDTSVIISVNATDPDNISTVLANITLPNGTIRTITLLANGLFNDNFNANSENTTWTPDGERAVISPGQNCIANINTTDPGAMHTEITGTGTAPNSTLCGYVSKTHIDGDFDLNVTFSARALQPGSRFLIELLQEHDTRLSDTKEIEILYKNTTAGSVIKAEINDNGTEIALSEESFNQTRGMFRISRIGNNFTWYVLNNTQWRQFANFSNANISRGLHMRFEIRSDPPLYGRVNVSWDNFSRTGDNFTHNEFNETRLDGQYNITITANDTFGASNTSRTNFTVIFINDAPTTPQIIVPTPGSVQHDIFNITWAPVTDEEGDTLLYNITLLDPDNASLVNFTITANQTLTINRTTFPFNTSLVLDGQYNLRIIVYENESGQNLSNSNTLSGNFTIDNTGPRAINPGPDNLTRYNVTETANFTINITDRFSGVDIVHANVTKPNGTLEVFNLGILFDAIYSDGIDDTGEVGNYSIRFSANDTLNNRNATVTLTLQVVDVVQPNVTNLVLSINATNQSGPAINISANISDNDDILAALARIIRSNGSVTSVRMLNSSGSNRSSVFRVNYTPALGDPAGLYNVTIVANDTSHNANDSVRASFIVNDNIRPIVINASPNGTSFNQSTPVRIAANATDNGPIDTVLVNVTLPNGTVRVGTATRTGDIINITFNETTTIGTYNYTVIANDSGGNVNATVGSFFITLDTQPPFLISITPANASRFNITNIVNISANATDNNALASVIAYVRLPNGSVEVRNMTNASSITWRVSFTNLTLGGVYNITIIANDTAGNFNATTLQIIREASRFIDVLDEKEFRLILTNITVLANASGNLEIFIEPANQTITRIIVHNHSEASTNTLIRLANQSNDSSIFAQEYLADFSSFNMTSAEIFINATGENLFKCTDVDLANLRCTDRANYTLIRDDLIPGQLYSINISPDDPIFGETLDGSNITDDNWMNEGTPNQENGLDEFLRVGKASASAARRILIRFNISGLPNGVRIDNATLQLFFESIVGGNDKGNRTISIHRVNQSPPRPWNETTSNWNNLNSTTAWTIAGGDFRNGQTTNATFNDSALDSFINWNVTADVADFYANSTFNFGWVLKDTNETATSTQRDFRSTEYSANASQRPRLAITFTDIQPPNATALNVTPGNITAGGTLNISVNVTDNINVSVVLAQITRADGSAFNVTLTILNGSLNNITYNGTVTTSGGNAAGLWNITIIANDTTGNVNNTARTNFTVIAGALAPTPSGGAGGGGGAGLAGSSSSSKGCSDNCAPGERRCAGLLVQTCSTGSDGCLAWNSGTACSSGETCGNGRCTPACTPRWSCDDWSDCDAGLRTRSCTDSAGCGTIRDKPTDTETCEPLISAKTQEAAPTVPAKAVPIATKKGMLWSSIWMILLLLLVLALVGYTHYTHAYKGNWPNTKWYKTMLAQARVKAASWITHIGKPNLEWTLFKGGNTPKRRIYTWQEPQSRSWAEWWSGLTVPAIRWPRFTLPTLPTFRMPTETVTDPHKGVSVYEQETLGKNTLFVPTQYLHNAAQVIDILQKESTPSIAKLNAKYTPLVVSLCRRALADAASGKLLPDRVKEIKLKGSYDYIGYPALVAIIKQMARGHYAGARINIHTEEKRVLFSYPTQQSKIEEYIDLSDVQHLSKTPALAGPTKMSHGLVSGKPYVHKVELLDTGDLRHILEHLREGSAVLFVDIHKLRLADVEKLKRLLAQIKRVSKLQGGDILGLGDRYILATSGGIKIEKKWGKGNSDL
ncbi:DNRLRE domain-containing protein, partial [Candidatus Woesearchaeota archaeon]|nr:DNRLRE domain-containing protein [Candidatus Woesearchaeota archaeon]